MVRHTGDKDINTYYTLFLQPLKEVHLASTDIEHDYNNYRKFNGKYLDVFFIIGVFILLIAMCKFYEPHDSESFSSLEGNRSS